MARSPSLSLCLRMNSIHYEHPKQTILITKYIMWETSKCSWQALLLTACTYQKNWRVQCRDLSGTKLCVGVFMLCGFKSLQVKKNTIHFQFGSHLVQNFQPLLGLKARCNACLACNSEAFFRKADWNSAFPIFFFLSAEWQIAMDSQMLTFSCCWTQLSLGFSQCKVE